MEKIYANMSACHLKNENWQRALETANKVGGLPQSSRFHIFIFNILLLRLLLRTKIISRLCSGKAKPLASLGSSGRPRKY